MRHTMTATAITGLLLFAPFGANASREAVRQIAVSSSAAEDGELERASRESQWASDRPSLVRRANGAGAYWVREWRRRYRVEHHANRERAHIIRRLRRELSLRLSPTEAVCAVFGGYCSQALAVAECESHLNPYAQNGQYMGAFQMGASERARYGHGPTVVEQARAAYRYFVDSGRDWSPWECRP